MGPREKEAAPREGDRGAAKVSDVVVARPAGPVLQGGHHAANVVGDDGCGFTGTIYEVQGRDSA